MINLIAAVALDGAIGKDDKMLWKISEDLQYYKARTTGNVVIIGRKTYSGLPKIALKNRNYVVAASQCHPVPEDDAIDVRFSPDPKYALLRAQEDFPGLDIYIGGGQSIYEQLLDDCEYAYITWVGNTYPDADTHFPVKKFHAKFELISESDWIETDDSPAYKFSTYKRIE